MPTNHHCPRAAVCQHKHTLIHTLTHTHTRPNRLPLLHYIFPASLLFLAAPKGKKRNETHLDGTSTETGSPRPWPSSCRGNEAKRRSNLPPFALPVSRSDLLPQTPFSLKEKLLVQVTRRWIHFSSSFAAMTLLLGRAFNR